MIKIHYYIFFFAIITLHVHAMEMNPIVFKTGKSELAAAVTGMHRMILKKFPEIAFVLANPDLAMLVPESNRKRFEKDMGYIARIGKAAVWNDNFNYETFINLVKNSNPQVGD